MRRLLLLLTLALTLVAQPASAEGVIGGGRLGDAGLVVGTALDPANPIPPFPANIAKSYLVADLNTNQVLAAKNAHMKLLPASTIKALTALALLPVLDPTDVYTVQRKDTQVETTKIGLITGRRYTVDSLMHALMIESANDAGMALAGAAGGMPKALAYMNNEAKRLQAFDTVAKNPHGLNATGQTTSAYDLALIAKEGLKRPEFAQLVKTWRYTFKDLGTKPKIKTITNHNKLLKSYPGMIGVKNGYTRLAKNTYIGAATRDGRTLVITLMGLPPTVSRDTVAKAMLNWGFTVAGKVEPVGTLVDPVGPPLDQQPVTAVVAKKVSDTTGQLPGVVRAALIPFALVALLRTRVLVKRRIRRRRRMAYRAGIKPTLR